MNRLSSLFYGLLSSALLSTPALAVVVGGAVTDIAGNTASDAFDQGGTFVNLTNLVGLSVGNNNQQTNNLYAFNEDQNIALTSTLSVNLGSNPTAGTIVASHYVFFDPGPSRSQQGWVDFDSAIIGVITSLPNLIASDGLLANSVTYNSPGLRGLESGDSVSRGTSAAGIVNGRLFVDWTASDPGDYVRVLTEVSPGASVPLPASATLLAGAFGLAAGLRRRQKRQN